MNGREQKHMEEIRRAYQLGRHAKGFTLQLNAQGTGSIDLNLSGFDSMFLGLVVAKADGGSKVDFVPGADAFTLKVNNDVVIDQADPYFFSASDQNPRDFVPFMRPIFGNDDIELTYNGAAQATLSIVVYYLGSPNLNRG